MEHYRPVLEFAGTARVALKHLYESAPDLFGRLFLLEAEVELDAEIAASLLQANLIRIAGGLFYAANFRVWVIAGCFIVSDLFTYSSRDRVYPIFPDESDFFGRNLVVREGDSVLDLCTGSGIIAVLCARKAGRVIASDVSPRALEFAAFNAALNNVGQKIVFVHSDLFSNILGKFDLITFNPPFIAAPNDGCWYTHGAAGVDGTVILERILQSCGKHLAEGSRIQFIANSFGTNDSVFVIDLLRRYYPVASLGVTHVFNPTSIPLEEYARVFEGSAGYDGWLERLAGRGFDRIYRVLVTASNDGAGIYSEKRNAGFKYLVREEFGKPPVKISPRFSGGWAEMLARYRDVSSYGLVKTGPMSLPVLLGSGSVKEFRLYYYEVAGEPFYVIINGSLSGSDTVFVRVHSACSFAHVFKSQRCDCAEQLDSALQLIAQSGGVLIYAWAQEGRGIGFKDHVRVYMAQDKGYDTVSAYAALGLPIDCRNYAASARILLDLGVKAVKLLTNNPRKVWGLEHAGIVVERVPLTVALNALNKLQFSAKKEKMGHRYDLDSV
ncbi:MAG: HemK2/MTQ2 family protein methyltransferase [Candidatus Micrarchaeota archaeon]